MKVTYPLSLKVSLWLMLNLLLLAALGVGFFVVQGGLGWSALVSGRTGDRAQAKINIIAAEVSAASAANRNAVLERFKAAYGPEFFAYRTFDGQVAGGNAKLPEPLQARVDALRPTGRWAFNRDFGPGGRGFGPPPDGGRGGGGGGPRERNDAGERTSVRRDAPADGIAAGTAPAPASNPDGSQRGGRNGSGGDGARGGGGFNSMGERGGPNGSNGLGGLGGPGPSGSGVLLNPYSGPGGPGGLGGPGGAPDPAREREFGRTIIRGGSPVSYWVVMRAFIASERGRPAPGMIVARIDSFWALLHFLDLQSWVMAATAVLVLSVLFWLPLVRSITRSLGQLTTATEQIAQGRFETRVDSGRRDELGKLGESVNRMAARLDAHMTGQKRFLGDVAHELCSPLARLQMATGILADQAPKDLQETVGDVREEVQQMSTLVNELLAFTKSGMQPREVALVPTSLSSVVSAATAREGAQERVTVDIPEDLSVLADTDQLGRALGNLIRNAIRYAGDAGPISVTAARDGGHVIVAVEDNGPGVPPADLDRLGEPFFRPELARTRESGGVGLGLAIVRNAIAACGGEVRFANRTPKGFRAEVRLKGA